MHEDLTELDFRIEDEVNGQPLTPATASLPLLSGFLHEIEAFIKGDLPGITLAESRLQIQEGSLKIRIRVPAALGFSVNEDLRRLEESGDLDLVQPKRALILERWQTRVRKSSRRRYSIGGSSALIKITSSSHFEHGNEKSWVRVEKYFTGKIYNAGGKLEPNVHVEMDNGETIRVDATEKQLAGRENPLFKTMTLRVQAEEHLRTKALRNLQLIEFAPHALAVDEDGLAALWRKGAEAWKEVKSASAWVEAVRGNS